MAINCSKCGAEITKEDERTANWGEMMGSYYHRRCPDQPCAICGKPIAKGEKAERMPFSVSDYRHIGCRMLARKPEATQQANPQSWIAKRK